MAEEELSYPVILLERLCATDSQFLITSLTYQLDTLFLDILGRFMVSCKLYFKVKMVCWYNYDIPEFLHIDH